MNIINHRSASPSEWLEPWSLLVFDGLTAGVLRGLHARLCRDENTHGPSIGTLLLPLLPIAKVLKRLLAVPCSLIYRNPAFSSTNIRLPSGFGTKPSITDIILSRLVSFRTRSLQGATVLSLEFAPRE